MVIVGAQDTSLAGRLPGEFQNVAHGTEYALSEAGLMDDAPCILQITHSLNYA